MSLLTIYVGNVPYGLKSASIESVTKRMGLTFRKAFFSKAFMINGGMAGSKDRPTYTAILGLFSAYAPPATPTPTIRQKAYITFRLFSHWQSETICSNSFKYFSIIKTRKNLLDF